MVFSNQQLMANAMGGKSARACDSCIRKRARWYCAADDAFLCQSCDSSVHSANPLARRHERLRLQISSIKSSSSSSSDHQQQLLPPPLHNLFIPAWQRGMTKKPRTPRRHVGKKYNWQLPLVPETEETNSSFDEEEQMHYQVPIFDPLCTSVNSIDQATKNEFLGPMHVGFLPSEIELAEFAADVETLLGNGLEEEPFDMEALGILAYKEKYDQKDSSSSSSLLVKVEDDNYDINGKIILLDEEQDLDDLDISFDYDEEESPAIYEGDTKMEVKLEEETTKENNNSMILLRLNYEGVIKAWDDKKSPWTSGGRPELKSTECWPDCMVERCGMVHQQQQQTTYGDMINIGMMGRHVHGHGTIVADEGREARVSRYREKRRTRLFSKKIRYEVRKLNAEKRPRMKGRFVKRTNLTVGTHVQPPVFSINA